MRYFCVRKHPEIFIGRGPGHTVYASFPAWNEYMTFTKWVEAGRPNDVRFIGQGRRPQELARYWASKITQHEGTQ